MDACLLRAGGGEGHHLHTLLGTARLDALRIESDLGLQVTCPRDTWTLIMVRGPTQGLRANAIALRPGDVVLAPPGARLDAHLPASTEWVAVQSRWVPSCATWVGMPRDPICLRAEHGRGTALLCHLTSLMETLRSSPHERASRESRVKVEIRLASAVRIALRGAERLSSEAGACPVRRLEVVRAACDAMSLRLGQRVSVGSLCDLTGVSPRALAYYFRQTLGVAPMAWLRAKRFTEARRTLLREKHGGASVTTIATRCGFTHLGRFSVEYRARFGESPSETLARRRQEGRRGGRGRPGRPAPQPERTSLARTG